jgi:hypothetical protein
VSRKIRPLKTLGEKVFGADSIRIAAFANRNTQAYKHRTKVKYKDDDDLDDLDHIQLRAVDLQEWLPPDDDDWLLEGPIVQTGYDEKGFLRCGVCGAKMKLTKKDRARGWTEHDKLNKHMKMLHDREQAKRTTRLNQLKGKKKKKFLEGVKGVQMKKYKAAQVGLDRGPTNDWFTILRENSVECFSSDDVDTDLIKKANNWLNKQKKAKIDHIILMVVSEDADFVPLLQDVRKKNPHQVNLDQDDDNGTDTDTVRCYYSACATWNLGRDQTQSLKAASDFVIQYSISNDNDATYKANLVAQTERAKRFLHHHNKSSSS